MVNPRVAIGIDFGTLSGRAVVVCVDDGRELGSAVSQYSHGVITQQLPNGRPLGPSWALQSPADWRAVLSEAVPAALASSGARVEDVVGIATDFTASTVLPVTSEGTPLCEIESYAARPHAWPKLWKHHAAQAQADRINSLARDRNEPWLSRYGGAISSEWQFAKALQMLEEDPDTYACADLWVEAADWIVWELCGRLIRNPCTMGYKGMFQDGAYPTPDFLGALHPDFAQFAVEKLAGPTGKLGGKAGELSQHGSALTGLPAGTPVAVGNVDAHVTAAAANAVRPGRLVAIMGTSTCHVVNGEKLVEVPGMCGVVDGGIVAGSWGYEAGQSGVGDIFGWFVDRFVSGEIQGRAQEQNIDLHEYLSRESDHTPVGGHGLIALDWMSGNRSVLVDHDLSGLVVGLTLATPPEDVYRALVESTAFGTRMIVETFASSGVPVEEFVAAGGLTKNHWLMQLYADVLGMKIRCLATGQGPALGSAIHAAVAAGVYPDVATAAAAMGQLAEGTYEPDSLRHEAYSRLYAEYVELHDWFGRGGTDVMRRLAALRREVTANAIGKSG